MALPAYKLLIGKWTQLQSTIWELSHYIGIGLDKLRKYINEGRKTRIYALSMIVNPSIKLQWLNKHWTTGDVIDAREWMLQAACGSDSTINSESAIVAGRSLSAGYGRMNSLNVAVRRSAFQTTSSLPQMPTITISEPLITREEGACKDLEQDRKDAEWELQRYEDTGVLLDIAERTIDIIRFWEQKEHVFPLLFHVAMDVLPAQASSVPLERIFSSSKETCTLRRNRISPTMLEALQILKVIYKQERLNFTADLVADEQDYVISGPVTLRAVDELMALRSIYELNELLKNASRMEN